MELKCEWEKRRGDKNKVNLHLSYVDFILKINENQLNWRNNCNLRWGQLNSLSIITNECPHRLNTLARVSNRITTDSCSSWKRQLCGVSRIEWCVRKHWILKQRSVQIAIKFQTDSRIFQHENSVSYREIRTQNLTNEREQLVKRTVVPWQERNVGSNRNDERLSALFQKDNGNYGILKRNPTSWRWTISKGSTEVNESNEDERRQNTCTRRQIRVKHERQNVDLQQPQFSSPHFT